MKTYVTYKAPMGQTRAVVYEGRVVKLSGGIIVEVSSNFAEYLRSTIKGTPREHLFDFSFNKDSADLPQSKIGAQFIQEYMF